MQTLRSYGHFIGDVPIASSTPHTGSYPNQPFNLQAPIISGSQLSGGSYLTSNFNLNYVGLKYNAIPQVHSLNPGFNTILFSNPGVLITSQQQAFDFITAHHRRTYWKIDSGNIRGR